MNSRVPLQSRRQFIQTTAGGAITAALALTTHQASAQSGGTLPRRNLGKTGLQVSLLGLGGWHIGAPRESAEGERIIRAAIDAGVNFLDNSHDYHQGDSERRMGNAIKGRREEVVLMTKFNARDRKSAIKELEESLRLLQTDHLDIWQIHSVERAEDPDWLFSENGAIEALEQAKKEGKTRFVGFTGHKSPDYHMALLERKIDWDTIQMPLNVLDAHFRSFASKVLPKAVSMELGVIGMKPLASSFALRAAKPIECLHYAMNLPVPVTVTGCDSMERLEQALEAARTFKPLEEGEIAALLARTRDFGSSGEGEPFKTTTRYDNRPPATPPPYEA
jgi:aryl-alcohol dehydrogenase-like predicted oxidoreductase